MKRVFALMMLFSMAVIADMGHADVITRWNFNGDSTTSVPGGPTSPSPSEGAGTASLIGGTTATFASGTASGGSSDPVTTNPPNFGWNTTTYAASGAENNQRGVQFFVSTVGFENITVNWDTRHSNTSSRFQRFLYTLDGTNFIDGNFTFTGTPGDTWYNGRTVDLSSIPGASNNPNFGFQIVATFDPNGTNYVASGTTQTYGPTGTWRFDMVTVNGTPAIPEPSSLAVLGAISLLGAIRRRK